MGSGGSFLKNPDDDCDMEYSDVNGVIQRIPNEVGNHRWHIFYVATDWPLFCFRLNHGQELENFKD